MLSVVGSKRSDRRSRFLRRVSKDGHRRFLIKFIIGRRAIYGLERVVFVGCLKSVNRNVNWSPEQRRPPPHGFISVASTLEFRASMPLLSSRSLQRSQVGAPSTSGRRFSSTRCVSQKTDMPVERFARLKD